MADEPRADLGEQRLGHTTGCDPRCCLTGTGAFEHVSCISEPVLLHPCEVGVSGAWLGKRFGGCSGSRAHLFDPFRPLGIGDVDTDGRAKRAAVAHTPEDRYLVDFEALARSAPVAETPTGEFCLDCFDRDGQTSGDAFKDDRKGLTVRFAGSEETQHCLRLLDRLFDLCCPCHLPLG